MALSVLDCGRDRCNGHLRLAVAAGHQEDADFNGLHVQGNESGFCAAVFFLVVWRSHHFEQYHRGCDYNIWNCFVFNDLIFLKMSNMVCRKTEMALFVFSIAVMAIAFFLICRFGFFLSDDYSMGFGNTFSLQVVLAQTKDFYLNWGGGLFSAVSQFLFCGLLGDNKLWFDIVNTIVYVCLMIIGCKLISPEVLSGKKRTAHAFVLFFWFLCPVPSETLFWVVGSTGYLWTTTMIFLFLLIFIKNKDSNSSILMKIFLFLLSMFFAASLIPSVSICGAFVVYYLLHFDKFKGNVIFLVSGFVLGSLVLLCAPGNFVRASTDMAPFVVKMKDLVTHPISEIVKYKALWLFVFTWLLTYILNKNTALEWAKKDLFLLLVLGWSVIAFSVVFRPANRALFFTETLSILLFFRLIQVFPAGELPTKVVFLHSKRVIPMFLSLLFAFWIYDSGMAIRETGRQNNNNKKNLEMIAEANGFSPVDVYPSKHRMAIEPTYPYWSWEGIANQLGLDSVHVYPYYCLEKYYSDSVCDGRVFVDEQGLLGHGDASVRNMGMVFIRNKNEERKDNRLITTISYSRPRKWYYVLVNMFGKEYDYDRTCTMERNSPDQHFKGFDFYVIWMKKENLRGLKDVEITLEGM